MTQNFQEGSSGGDNGDGSAADDSPAASEARAPLTKRSSARRQSLTQSGRYCDIIFPPFVDHFKSSIVL